MPLNTSTDGYLPSEVTLDTELIDWSRVTNYNNFALGLRANITGGGQLSVDTLFNLKWSERFLVICQGRGPDSIPFGYIGIGLPASGTIVGEGGATSKTVTAAGIPLASWDALYFVWRPGIDQRISSAASDFRVVNYSTTFTVPPEWLLLAQRNSDSGLVQFTTGHYLSAGQTVLSSNSLPSGSVKNTELALAPAATLKGNNLPGSSSPRDLTAAEVAALLPGVIGASALAAGSKGLVPAPGTADIDRVLTGNGAWGVEILFASGTGSAVTIGPGETTPLRPFLVEKAKSQNSVAILVADDGLPAGIVLQISNLSINSQGKGTVNYRLINVTNAAISVPKQFHFCAVLQQ